MKAELVPAKGRRPPIPIVKDVTLIGRHADCEIQIDREGLSQRHCLIVRTDGLLIVRDLLSTNGTKVNGQRIRWAALMPRDVLSVAGYKMRVYLGPDDLPSPSEMTMVDPPADEPGAESSAIGGPAPE